MWCKDILDKECSSVSQFKSDFFYWHGVMKKDIFSPPVPSDGLWFLSWVISLFVSVQTL